MAEGLNSHQRPGGDEVVRDGGAEGLPGGDAGLQSQPFQGFQRGFANAAGGSVDDPLQGHRIMGIADEPQVGEQILDLGALIKAESTDHSVGDVVAAQCLLHQSGLGVGAVEHRAMCRTAVFPFG